MRLHTEMTLKILLSQTLMWHWATNQRTTNSQQHVSLGTHWKYSHTEYVNHMDISESRTSSEDFLRTFLTANCIWKCVDISLGNAMTNCRDNDLKASLDSLMKNIMTKVGRHFWYFEKNTHRALVTKAFLCTLNPHSPVAFKNERKKHRLYRESRLPKHNGRVGQK